MVWSPFINMNCIEANKIFLILRFFISLWATKAFSRPCYATYCVANLMEILLVVPENYSGGSYLNHRPFSQHLPADQLPSTFVKQRLVSKHALHSKFLENFRNHFRNSHQRCSMKKRVLRNFAKFTEKHQCQSLFFNKVAACNLPLY